MKLITSAFACFLICVRLCSAQVQQKTGASPGASGTAKGADGTTITSGAMTISRIPDSVALPRNAKTVAVASIRTDGTFQFPPLVDGTYQVCPQVPGGWINPCTWATSTALRISISASQTAPNINIVLKKGALVSVRVEDPEKLFAANAAKGASLLIGVGTDSFAFHRAALVAQDAGGRTYQVLIPFDRSLGIIAASASFQVTDSVGRRLLASVGNAIPVLVPSGQQPPTVALRVSTKVTP